MILYCMILYHNICFRQAGLPVWGSYSFHRVASLGRMSSTWHASGSPTSNTSVGSHPPHWYNGTNDPPPELLDPPPRTPESQ